MELTNQQREAIQEYLNNNPNQNLVGINVVSELEMNIVVKEIDMELLAIVWEDIRHVVPVDLDDEHAMGSIEKIEHSGVLQGEIIYRTI